MGNELITIAILFLIMKIFSHSPEEKATIRANRSLKKLTKNKQQKLD